MQIPSSLASIVSYWFPNLGDTEKKAQGRKTLDPCNPSLDQVLQIYKTVGAEGRDSSSQFIRELEQTSWQQQQVTSGIFNHISSITANINRISGRFDKLEPETQLACVFFLALVISINIFILKQFKNLENEITGLKKKHSKLEVKHVKLQKKHIELKKWHVKLKNDHLKLKITHIDGNIKSIEKLTALQEKTSKLTSEFGDFKTTQFFEITGLEKDIKDLKADNSEEIDRIYMLLEKAGIQITPLALSSIGSQDGSWGGSQSSGSRTGSPKLG